MVFTITELFDMVMMVGFVGYIFKDMLGQHGVDVTDPEYYLNRGRFDVEGFKFAAMVTAPAIILHEFGHKFMALAFGMIAEFHAAYQWLFLGVLLKLFGSSFIFFVPAYVRWGCPAGSVQCVQTLAANPWIGSLIGLAGPLCNLALWQGSLYVMNSRKKLKRKQIAFLGLSAQVNKFLFFFNLIPIPGFDGFHVVRGLFATFF